MLETKEKNDKTLSDAARHLRVSPKTVRDWIKKRIIPEPPKKNYGIRKIDIFNEKYLEQASKLVDEYRSAQDELVNKMGRFNNAKLQKEYMKGSIDQIVEEKIFVQAKDAEQEELLDNELYKNHIPFNDFYNPRDDKTTYRISTRDYNSLLLKGVELEIIEVNNIGDLSLQERNKIKQYNKSQAVKKRKEVLDELRAEYGPL